MRDQIAKRLKTQLDRKEQGDSSQHRKQYVFPMDWPQAKINAPIGPAYAVQNDGDCRRKQRFPSGRDKDRP